VRVQLRPMNDEEFAAWLPRMRDGYAADMVSNGGMAQEKATAKAIADTARLFPDDKPADDQAVFVLEADGEPVGDLWVCERDDSLYRCLFIYDVNIDEPHRG